MMRVGIAADHGAFALKGQLEESLRNSRYEIVDFGAHQLNPADDYSDFIIPLAKAVAAEEVERGIALCGSGIGASIAADKVFGVRAGLINDVFFARQGVEDDDMNVFCLGGKSHWVGARLGTGRDFPGRALQQRRAPPASSGKSASA
jgi:ribose 5-phosphate isomerase B